MIKCSITESSIQDRISLPSMGLFYGDTLKDGMVTVSSMNTRDEKKLAGGGSVIKRMDSILSSRVELPSTMKVGDLLISDKFFLMMVIRSLSYGVDYQVKLRCPECASSYKHTINIIKDIPVTYLPLDFPYREPFSCKLPISGDVIEYRHLRGFDEAEIDKYSSGKSDQGEEGDPGYTYGIAKRIIKINGEERDIFDTIRYVESMVTKDSTFFRLDRDKYDSGIETEFSVMCQRCDSAIEIDLPMTKEFFRPTSR